MSLVSIAPRVDITLLTGSEHYFEMSKPDAERALTIYRTFAKQTEQVVAFLSVARQYEGATRLEIPKLKHAPTGLASSLEEYLHDPDFEINRRQYMAQKEAKKNGQASSSKSVSSGTNKPNVNGSTNKSQPQFQSQPPPQAKGPAPDLIDFFESIEQNQQPMAAPPSQMMNGQPVSQFDNQQTGFMGQAPQAVMYNGTNPFANMMSSPQQQSAGTSTQQQGQPFFNPAQMTSLPQNTMQTFQPQPLATAQQQSPFGTGQQLFSQQQQSPQQFNTGTQSFFNPAQQSQPSLGSTFQPSVGAQPGVTDTNPFRASMMPQPTANSQSMFLPSVQSPPSQQPINPFRSVTLPTTLNGGSSPFNSPAPTSAASSFFSTVQSPQSVQSFQSIPASHPIQPMQTGMNPFKSAPPSTFHTPITSPLASQQTGTNPFRQSAFTNQQTGQGWQASQGTMGGLEQLPTIPVFPRPQPGS